MPHNVLVLTGDVVGTSMAGPAIRAFEIAKKIAPHAKVRLVSTVGSEIQSKDFEISYSTRSQLTKHVKWSDLIIFQGTTFEPWMAKRGKMLVADLYDPIHLEYLEQQKEKSNIFRFAQTINVNAILNRQILLADHFLCASEKQRDFWLGQFAALGRLNPDNYDQDTSLRRLISVVPFGVQDDPPVQTEHLIKGKIAGISETDKVVIWGGGIYNWFDPLTLIKAIKVLSEQHAHLKLVFMGTKHPNPHVPAMQMLVDSRNLAAELGLLDTHVFFNEGWVPYAQRANALLDADLGVSTHLDHLETAFSFRTRILDYLWSGLPIVATRGDTFESIIESNNLGIVVNPGDVDELAQAIERLLFNEALNAQIRTNVKTYADSMHWQNTLEPLVDFVRSATPSADHSSKYSQALLRLSKVSMGPIRARLILYFYTAQRFGVIATVKSVLNNFASRFTKK